ncbi:DUF4138 domain-containing protein [uncultured Maribacter sp.]|uniref:DUF4138 domain-containing protein n=1 Tax=uncultured Maribacter sp. TaxID=431308 RepID=UPI0030D7716F|tara:strand:+ start:4473 stop:5312 length:840 start_codon:yes stop_codon:yes gene_type:complete
MKKYILISTLIIFAFAPPHCSAQTTNQLLDTIYANDTKNVALFFPEPIRQGVTGADNFVFTYNREKEQYFGLLQATPGVESNLLVINGDGSVFSYILRYKKQLSKLNYFIPLTNSIGNERPIVQDSVRSQSLDIVKTKYDYRKFCSALLKRKPQNSILKRRNEGIVLSVERIVFDKAALYFVLEIRNNSTLDYDVNFLDLSIETRQKGKKKSAQRLFQEPLYTYNLPSKILKNETVRFVYVLPKFSLSNDRRVVMELYEENGERSVELKIPHRFINNPD